MLIEVERFLEAGDATVSRISIAGEPICYGLEDQFREIKVPGSTRIPAGEYAVTLRKEGGFHHRYAARFPEFHKGMLWIRDVPGFQWILIHCGNTSADTAGCLLVGRDYSQNRFGELMLYSSVDAYRDLYPRVAAAILAGEAVRIRFGPADEASGAGV